MFVSSIHGASFSPALLSSMYWFPGGADVEVRDGSWVYKKSSSGGAEMGNFVYESEKKVEIFKRSDIHKPA